MQRKRIPLCNTLSGFILWEKILSLWRAQKERDQKGCDTAFIEISFIISIKHPRRQFTMVFLGRFCSHHEHVFLSEAGRGYNKKPKVFYWSKKNTKKNETALFLFYSDYASTDMSDFYLITNAVSWFVWVISPINLTVGIRFWYYCCLLGNFLYNSWWGRTWW